jgi:hypothetical protein
MQLNDIDNAMEIKLTLVGKTSRNLISAGKGCSHAVVGKADCELDWPAALP